jgi:hypothetical protein
MYVITLSTCTPSGYYKVTRPLHTSSLLCCWHSLHMHTQQHKTGILGSFILPVYKTMPRPSMTTIPSLHIITRQALTIKRTSIYTYVAMTLDCSDHIREDLSALYFRYMCEDLSSRRFRCPARLMTTTQAYTFHKPKQYSETY